jgi:hypothetical protein
MLSRVFTTKPRYCNNILNLLVVRSPLRIAQVLFLQGWFGCSPSAPLVSIRCKKKIHYTVSLIEFSISSFIGKTYILNLEVLLLGQALGFKKGLCWGFNWRFAGLPKFTCSCSREKPHNLK